jgi:HSP20 family protein
MAQYRLSGPWAAGSSGGFDDLRREMDALLGRFATGSRPAPRGGVFPPVNLYESEDAYVLTAELPGVAPEDIEVSLEGDSVALRGERRIEHPTDRGANAHRLERQAGSFRRSFQLPTHIDADKVEAVHKNGVLMLQLPKKPEHKPRQVAVRAG